MIFLEWVKVFLYIIIIFVTLMLLTETAPASSKAAQYTCIHYHTLPMSEGRGKTPAEAWAKMAESCFDNMIFELKKRGDEVTKDRSMLFIDQCVNRKCSTLTQDGK